MNLEFKQLNQKMISKVIIIVFLLNLSLVSFITQNNIQDSNKTKKTATIPENGLDSNSINQNKEKLVDKALSGFTDGFMTQDNSGDPSIAYFIQNPAISVGFGSSKLKILVKDVTDKNKPIATEVIQSFQNSNIVEPIAFNPIISSSIYFIGSNNGIHKQQYTTLIYKNLYNNIDLKYTIENGNLKYNFYVYPGGNPKDIQIRWNGPVSIEKTVQGMKISITTVSGRKILLDKKPVSYQDGKTAILSDFYVTSTASYGFTINNFDSEQLLVIDPTILLYSTFVGGSNSDYGNKIARDNNDDLYITGSTSSANFPMVNSFNNTYGGATDAFVIKLSKNGQSIVFSTYIGGNIGDQGMDIYVDANGNSYVTGITTSKNFPTTTNAFNRISSGGYDAFVFKLSADGSSLLYSTYVGGSNSDYVEGMGLTVDKNGYAYVTAGTSSSDFPTTTNAFNRTFGGIYDIYVFKLSTDGSSLIYSTYVGGSAQDGGYDIVVDDSGNAFVCGWTYSTNFPTINAYNATLGGNDDVVVFELSATGSSLIYSTLIGGSGFDAAFAIARDSNNNVYVTGFTGSNNFPTTANAFNRTFGYGFDIFVLKLYNTGSSLLYSTYIGGSGTDYAEDIAIDSQGNAYVTGFTTSRNFPMINSYNSTFGGSQDAYVIKISTNNATLFYSTYIGGISSETGFGIVLDKEGNAIVTGQTSSGNFPVQNGFNNTYQNYDAFVFKIVTKLNTYFTPTQVSVIGTSSPKNLEIVWNEPFYPQSFLYYNIYRGTASGTFKFLNRSLIPQFIDSQIIKGIMYYYAISAVYSFGEGPISNEIAGIVPSVPAAPILQITKGQNFVYLEWNAPKNGGSTIIEYQIFRGFESGQYSFVGITDKLYFNDSALSGGTKYFYVVAAINGVGKGVYSAEISATPFGAKSLASPITITVTTSVPVSEQQGSLSTSSNPKNSPGFEVLTLIGGMSILTLIVLIKRKKVKKYK